MGEMVAIEKEKSDSDMCCPEPAEPRYPWGTQIDLKDELVEQLGLGSLALGEEVQIRAVAVMTARRENSSESEGHSYSEKCVTLQLTKIGVSAPGPDHATALYGEK